MTFPTNPFDEFLQNIGPWFTEHGPAILFTLLGFLLGYLLLHVVADRLLYAWARVRGIDPATHARFKTMRSLISETLRIALGFSAFTAVLPQVGINPAVLAAGSFGMLAVFGLAFQQILQDIANGLIVFFTDRFREGETVTVAGTKGRVEKINLKLIILRNEEGEECTIPFRTITTIVNHSRKKAATAENLPPDETNAPQ